MTIANLKQDQNRSAIRLTGDERQESGRRHIYIGESVGSFCLASVTRPESSFEAIQEDLGTGFVGLEKSPFVLATPFLNCNPKEAEAQQC